MEINKIYNGDAYELIKQVPDNFVDLVIIDPPYDMTTGGTGGEKPLALRFKNRYAELKQKKLDVGMNLSFLQELERICKHIYIYGATKTYFSNLLPITMNAKMSI